MNRLVADLIAKKGIKVLDRIKRRKVGGKLRLMVCAYCRTPILRGFRLNGELITRAKVFCSNSCKMNKWREESRRKQRINALK
jgi:hypothetical protein